MNYIEQLNAKGYQNIKVEDTFDDGEFAQIKFRDTMNVSYIACFRNGQLLTII